MSFAQIQPCARGSIPVRGAVCSGALGPDLALIEAALARVIRARDYLRDGGEASASRMLRAALRNLADFRSTLDLGTGGPLIAQLDDLCEYMARRLSTAERQTQPEPMIEVTHLMHEVRAAWVTLAYV